MVVRLQRHPGGIRGLPARPAVRQQLRAVGAGRDRVDATQRAVCPARVLGAASCRARHPTPYG